MGNSLFGTPAGEKGAFGAMTEFLAGRIAGKGGHEGGCVRAGGRRPAHGRACVLPQEKSTPGAGLWSQRLPPDVLKGRRRRHPQGQLPGSAWKSPRLAMPQFVDAPPAVPRGRSCGHGEERPRRGASIRLARVHTCSTVDPSRAAACRNRYRELPMTVNAPEGISRGGRAAPHLRRAPHSRPAIGGAR